MQTFTDPSALPLPGLQQKTTWDAMSVLAKFATPVIDRKMCACSLILPALASSNAAFPLPSPTPAHGRASLEITTPKTARARPTR